MASNTISAHPKTSQRLTEHAKKSFLKASELARDFKYRKIDAVHLLFAIYLENGCIGANIMSDLGIKQEELRKLLESYSPGEKIAGKSFIPLSEKLKNIFIKAYSIAKDFNYPYVGTEHLTYAIIDSDDEIIKRLVAGTSLKNVNRSAKLFFDPHQLSNLPKMFDLPEISLSKNKARLSSATPFVDKFCINVNSETKRKKEILVGREREIERAINILGRKNKNNPLLIGDPGVGKTALVSGLSQMMNQGSVPPFLFGKKIMNLDIAQLIAGTSFRGEFESRLKEIIKEVSENKDIILFIDEIHNIVGAGNVGGSLDLANILKPALARGEIQLIGATTFSEYKKYIEKDAALERRFQPIQILEPTKEESEKILFGIRENYESFHNVAISDEAIILAIDLSMRYIQSRFLPDKAIDVIDETASNIRSKNKVSDFVKQIRELEDEKLSILEEKELLVSEENYEKAIKLRGQEKEIEDKIKVLRASQTKSENDYRVEIKSGDIVETISKISGVPAEKIQKEKTKKIKNIRKVLSSKIIGQTETIEKLTGVLMRSQSGISNADRPIGSFMFLGPTGVGKTLTAKVLAEQFFGSSKSLIRIDMSELMERHSVASLIGSPAGYIGYGEGGNLTEKVRRNPYSVILFDEIEKAHPDVFNILLQILEDGLLTDAEGTSVSFKNTIIILTSNIGTDEFTNAGKLGFETEKNSGESADRRTEKFNEIKDSVIRDLEKKMRPELLNRLDYILVFNSLGQKEIEKISDLEIKKLNQKLAEQKIKFSFKKNLINFIAKKSLAFDQGARLVRKNVQEMLENPIAEMIVYDKILDNKINVKVEKEKIKLA